MMRRTRLGLVCAGGGNDLLPLIRRECAQALPWDDARWDAEEARYLAYWQHQHAPVIA